MRATIYPVLLGALSLLPASSAAPADANPPAPAGPPAGPPADPVPNPDACNSFKQCIDLKVPVPVVATNYRYTQPPVDNDHDGVAWAQNITTWSTPNATARITGPVYVNQTFNVFAQLCVPAAKGPKADILQIATHGLGFDKRYFDVRVNADEYSYLDAAIKKGYSVLLYDRIGTGQSDKPDAYNIVQVPVEVEVLASLTKIVRDGKLISGSKIITPNEGIPSTFKPSKVVHISHSYGSFITALMLSNHGSISDGALLTGFLLNPHLNTIDVAHFDHAYAPQHDPSRFGEYTSGYFVLTTEDTLQKLFLRAGGFEKELLTYMEKVKQPETVGHYASEGTATFAPATDFKGPLQVSAGEFDYAVCAGDCRGQYDEATTKFLFPNATKIEPYLFPGVSHALTFAKGASAGYEVMFEFLSSHGL